MFANLMVSTEVPAPVIGLTLHDTRSDTFWPVTLRVAPPGPKLVPVSVTVKVVVAPRAIERYEGETAIEKFGGVGGAGDATVTLIVAVWVSALLTVSVAV